MGRSAIAFGIDVMLDERLSVCPNSASDLQVMMEALQLLETSIERWIDAVRGM